MATESIGCGFCLRERMRQHFGLELKPEMARARGKDLRQVDLADLSHHEVQNLLQVATGGRSTFFRDWFALKLAERLIGNLLVQGRKTINIWSAGCSTGQEPYALAMIVHRLGWQDQAQINILGTDVRKAAIDQALSGKGYLPPNNSSFAYTIPKEYAEYFLFGPDGVELHPEIMKMVTFRMASILDTAQLPAKGKMDLVFACNMLNHFDREHVIIAKQNLNHSISPRGILICQNADEKEYVLGELGTFRDRELEQPFEAQLNGRLTILGNSQYIVVYQKP